MTCFILLLMCPLASLPAADALRPPVVVPGGLQGPGHGGVGQELPAHPLLPREQDAAQGLLLPQRCVALRSPQSSPNVVDGSLTYRASTLQDDGTVGSDLFDYSDYVRGRRGSRRELERGCARADPPADGPRGPGLLQHGPAAPALHLPGLRHLRQSL